MMSIDHSISEISGLLRGYFTHTDILKEEKSRVASYLSRNVRVGKELLNSDGSIDHFFKVVKVQPTRCVVERVYVSDTSDNKSLFPVEWEHFFDCFDNSTIFRTHIDTTQSTEPLYSNIHTHAELEDIKDEMDCLDDNIATEWKRLGNRVSEKLRPGNCLISKKDADPPKFFGQITSLQGRNAQISKFYMKDGYRVPYMDYLETLPHALMRNRIANAREESLFYGTPLRNEPL